MTNLIMTVLGTGTVLAIAGCGIIAYGACAWHILEDALHHTR